MTREEAILCVKGKHRFNEQQQRWDFNPNYLVDALEALGLLKLDVDTPNVNEMARKAIANRLGRINHHQLEEDELATMALRAIHDFGFKIVLA